MFDSDNEVYFSNYNFPSIQIRKPKKKKIAKKLFIPAGNIININNNNNKFRGEKHVKTIKIRPSFLHKFQSVSFKKEYDEEDDFLRTIINKPRPYSFTDFVQPIITNNNNLNSFSNIQEKKYSKKTIKEIIEKIHNYEFSFDNKISFPFPLKVGNKKGLKRIVFFDIENVLLHCEYDNYYDYEKKIKIKLPSGLYVNLGVEIRPYFKEMINMIKENYFICIYTSCEKFYADSLLEILDDSNNIFFLKLYRDQCFKINIKNQNIFFKDLRIIEGVNFNDIIIVDSSAINFGLNLRNGIPISPYNKKNENDDELLNLGILLNNIYQKEGVGDFIESIFQSFF